MAEEIWKPIKGYEGYYEVSNLGRVRSLERAVLVLGKKHRPYFRLEPEQILKPFKHRGYYEVPFNVNKKRKVYGVHELVATAFLGERPFSRAHIRHLNCIPTDNRVENLAYGTSGENQADTYRLHKGVKQKLSDEDVKAIRKRLSEGDRQKDIASDYGITQSSVSHIKNGNTFWWLT